MARPGRRTASSLLARDTANHKITISLAHLSELAVFGSAPTALEPGDEPTSEAARLYLPVVALDGDLSAMVAPNSATPPAEPVVTPPAAPESAPGATSDEAPPVAESVTPEETPATESETPVDTPTPESTPAQTPASEGITPEETLVPESETPVETPLPETGADENAVAVPPEDAAETPTPESDNAIPDESTPETSANRLLLPWIAR